MRGRRGRYHGAVNRRLRALLLLLSLLWPPFSALLPAGQNARAEQLEHAMVHERALGHHHHADASLHVDDAEPSHQHLLDGAQLPALVAAAPELEPVPTASRIAAIDPFVPPSADPHRLIRPPRSNST